MPRMLDWSPVPTVVYTPFMAEEEVKGMEEDGPYATEMRGAIIGVCNCLSDTQMAARDNVEHLMDHVDSSNTWLMLMGHISSLHRCGDHLQESMGDVATLMT